MRKVTLIMTAILAVVAAVGMPLAHATNNVHTFHLGNSVVGNCNPPNGRCENLVTTTGSADTGTSQSIPAAITGIPTDKTARASAGTTSDTYVTCWEAPGITTTTSATASGSGTLTSGTGPYSMSSASMITTANDLIYAFAAYQPCVGETNSPTYTNGFTSMNAHGTSSSTGTHCLKGGNNPANDNTLNEYEIPSSTGSSTAATQSETFAQSMGTGTRCGVA